MTNSQALLLYSGKHVPEDLAQKNAEKLLKAMEILGEKHVLKKKITKLDNVETFFLKGN